MKFICPEIDLQAIIKDLYKVSSQYTEILDGALARTFYSYKKGITEYLYSKSMMKKYLSSITESTAAMTIAEYATYAGITIDDNLGATIEAMDVYFQSAELLKLKTEMWLTIFTDSGLCFYKPERLTTSSEIKTFEVLERVAQQFTDYGFFGESGYDLFSSVVQSDTMNIETIDDDVKTIILNTNKSAADITVIAVGSEVKPFDYWYDKGKCYLAVSQKEENGRFKVFGVREVKDTYTFVEGDVTNPNVSTGGGTSDHAALSHLAYADSGHTGFQPTMSKASGAEVDTGTDDAKYVTAKAMDD